MPEVTQQCLIQAPQRVVFESFTKASELREWLCDQAYTSPQVRGRYWLRWRDGSKIEGHYINIVAPSALAFVWRAADAPGQTTVRVAVEPDKEQTEVTLTHTGFGSDLTWMPFFKRCEERWPEALNNLKSVLEMVVDLRRAQRPYLGIRWRLSDHVGIEVLEVVGGRGAEVSELQPGDVITAVGEAQVSDYRMLVDALEDCSAGEMAELRVIRAGEELVLSVRLGAVPRSEMVLDSQSILAGVRDRQIRTQRMLSDTLLGTTEREASIRPAPDAWSVKEVLAHLSVTERNLHHCLWQIVMRGWDDTPRGNPATLPEAIAAAMSRTDTLSKLLDRFAQDQAETFAFFAALRPSIVAHKARYRRLAEAVDMSPHTRQHIDQIAATLKLIREKPHS